MNGDGERARNPEARRQESGRIGKEGWVRWVVAVVGGCGGDGGGGGGGCVWWWWRWCVWWWWWWWCGGGVAVMVVYVCVSVVVGVLGPAVTVNFKCDQNLQKTIFGGPYKGSGDRGSVAR